MQKDLPPDHAGQLGKTEADRARGAALRLLTLKSRSVSEMRERLCRRFDDETVEVAVNRLVAEGLLNDGDFAQQWRQSRERHKPRSPGMIRRELAQRGVADELIDQALEGFDPLEAAYRAVSRYAARQAKNDRSTFDRRVGAFLSRRGFESRVIRQTLHRLCDELDVGDSGATEESND